MPAAAEIEYNLLTYPLDTKGKAMPKKEASLKDRDEAIKKAQTLIASTKYSKVEIKQAFVDPKNNRRVESVIETLDYKKGAPIGMILLVTGVVFAGMAAFGLSFILGGQ